MIILHVNLQFITAWYEIVFVRGSCLWGPGAGSTLDLYYFHSIILQCLLKLIHWGETWSKSIEQIYIVLDMKWMCLCFRLFCLLECGDFILLTSFNKLDKNFWREMILEFADALNFVVASTWFKKNEGRLRFLWSLVDWSHMRLINAGLWLIIHSDQKEWKNTD